MTRRPAGLSVILVLALVAGVAACSSGGGSAASGAASAPAGGGFVTVSGAWARAAAKGGITAAYLQITNGRLASDTLVRVSTDAAGSTSIHETTALGSGMTGMQPVDGITIEAGQTVALEPGGYHIMLENLATDLVAGSTIRLVLTFEQSGPLNVTAEIRAS